MSLLVRLERFDAIDEILKKRREKFESAPTESGYLFTLESVAESLVEQDHIAEFESLLAHVQTSEEKLYLLMGAIIRVRLCTPEPFRELAFWKWLED